MTHHERIARVEEECASPLGYAMRGVSSWDQEYLRYLKTLENIGRNEEVRLLEIEVQVFGYTPMLYDR